MKTPKQIEENLKKELDDTVSAFTAIALRIKSDFLKELSELKSVKENKRWEPKHGDMVYNVNGFDSKYQEGNIFYENNFKQGLIKETLEQAETRGKWLEIDNDITNCIKDAEGMFEKDKNLTYYINPYDMLIKQSMGSYKRSSLIETNSKQSAKYVLKIIGKENIKFYFDNFRK